MEDFVQSQLNLEADLRYFQAGGQEGEATFAGTVLCCCWHTLKAQDSARPPVLSLAEPAACVHMYRGATLLLAGLGACTGLSKGTHAVAG